MLVAGAVVFAGCGGPTTAEPTTAGRRSDGYPQRVRAPASAGAPAVRPVGLHRPEALAAAPDGSVLISNQGAHQIMRRSPDGQTTVVAGTGAAGYSGDGGPAVDAEIDTPSGITVGADGTVYFADSGNNRVRAIATDGTIISLAGTGVAGSSGDGGPATAADLFEPVAVAVDGDGQVYIAESERVRVVSREGTINTLIAGGDGTLELDGRPTAFFPSAIAVSGSGALFVAGLSPKLVAEFDLQGRLRNVWDHVHVQVGGLAAASDGSIVVADYGQFSVGRITRSTPSTVIAFTRDSVPGVSGTFRPSGVAAGPDGTVYAVTDGVNGGAGAPALIAIDDGGHVSRLDVSAER